MSKQPIPLHSERNLTGLTDSALDGQIDDHARKINRALDERREALAAVADCEQRAVDAAWQLGKRLVEKKRRLPHGHFIDWCHAFTARTGVSGRSLRDYMKLARCFGSAASLRPSIRKSLMSIPSEPSEPRREPTPQERAIPAAVVSLDAHRDAPKPADLRPVVHETALGTGEPRSVHESEPVSAPTGDSVTLAVAKAHPHVARGDSDVEWYTPATIIEAARAVMGGIDLDPASCAHAQATVQAARYFDTTTNGLVQEWAGRVWLNPPYAPSLVDKFVDKLLASPAVTQAVVLTNNATETQWGAALLRAAKAVCFPTERVRFDRSDGPNIGVPQGQMIVGIGAEFDRDAFRERFGALGPVFIPLRTDAT